MRKAMLLLAVLAVLLPQSAHAVVTARRADYVSWQFNYIASDGDQKVLEGVAGNASATDRTIRLDTVLLRRVGIQVNATRDAGYTAIVVTATCSYDQATTYGNTNSLEGGSAGAWTASTVTITKSTSATTKEVFTFDVPLCDAMEILVTLTNGSATDAFDVYAKGSML